MNNDRHNELWPYSRFAAFLLVPLIWMVLASVLYLAEKTLGGRTADREITSIW